MGMMNNMKLITAPGLDALTELNRLRADYVTTGLYPIILGGEEDAEPFREMRPDLAEVETIIKSSREINVAQWFEAREAEYADLFEMDKNDWSDSPLRQLGIVTYMDPVPSLPSENVVIGLLPISSPWEAFAYLKWGGWNLVPSPAEHCALHRYWMASHGAEVVSIRLDGVECTVGRPPKDRISSIALAREHVAYAEDFGWQDPPSVMGAAAGLINSPSWFFWWD
jgi:hypothetical protein